MVCGKGVTRISASGERARLPQASKNLSTASHCQLYSCKRLFEQKRVNGKKPLFCSIPCRVAFFKEARDIGNALLKRCLTDPEAENYVKGLLEKIGQEQECPESMAE